MFYYRQIIEQAPLQIYSSALAFSPAKSVIKTQFKDSVPHWIRRLPNVRNDWGALRQMLEGHNEYVSAVKISPNGQLLASASNDETIRIWDASSGAALHTFNCPLDDTILMAPFRAIAFSPDSGMLASASSNGIIKIWDTWSGAFLREHKAPLTEIDGETEGQADCRLDGLAFLSETLLVSGWLGARLAIWDTSSKDSWRVLKTYNNMVDGTTFSPDGSLLASRGEIPKIIIWEVSSAEILIEREMENVPNALAIAFSSNSRFLASPGRNSTIEVWDVRAGTVWFVFGPYYPTIQFLAFSQCGMLLVSASGPKATLWDFKSKEVLMRFDSHDGNFADGAISHDNKLLITATGQSISVWDLDPRDHEMPHDMRERARAIAFAPDGKTLAMSSRHGLVTLWDTGLSKKFVTLGRYIGLVDIVVFSPDGRLLATGSQQGEVKIWEVSSKAELYTFNTHSGSIASMVFSLDGRLLASGSHDQTAKIWDLNLGQEILSRGGNYLSVSGVALSPNGKILASFSDVTNLWDIETGDRLRKPLHKMAAAGAFSPDGKLLALAMPKVIELRGVPTGILLQTIEFGALFVSSITSLAFSDDGTSLRSNRGPLCRVNLSEGSIVSRPELLDSVFVHDQWITIGSRKVLWVPPEHRPTHLAVHEGVIAFSHWSGRVLIMEISF